MTPIIAPRVHHLVQCSEKELRKNINFKVPLPMQYFLVKCSSSYNVLSMYFCKM